MRIASQGSDLSTQPITVTKVSSSLVNSTEMINQEKASEENKNIESTEGFHSLDKAISKEELEEAVNSINEFLHIDRRASKFVLHEGLEKYYVRLIDTETDEVIKEIPPERLLDAFYEMQKLAGMIIDEKV